MRSSKILFLSSWDISSSPNFTHLSQSHHNEISFWFHIYIRFYFTYHLNWFCLSSLIFCCTLYSNTVSWSQGIVMSSVNEWRGLNKTSQVKHIGDLLWGSQCRNVMEKGRKRSREGQRTFFEYHTISHCFIICVHTLLGIRDEQDQYFVNNFAFVPIFPSCRSLMIFQELCCFVGKFFAG